MRFCLILLVLNFNFWGISQCQEEIAYKFKDIVVTASRNPTTFSDVTRSVVILTKEDIELIPAQTINDVLEYIAGVDLKQRGPHGVQADLSIRGSTFEQTLVLIDGTKMSDPQTGHHNLDLPITVNDIERIEVLKGHGSRLYGPNAFGGVVNIITQKGDTRDLYIQGQIGEFGFFERSIFLSQPVGITNHRLSLTKKESSGYRENTEFDISSLAYSSSIAYGLGGEIDFSLGYTDKEFGANSFYSDTYPDEWEHTETTYFSSSADIKKDWMTFIFRLSGRRHIDTFILDRDRPEWYKNHHTTDVLNSEFQWNIFSKFGATALGGEIGEEKIKSSNLGNHFRRRGGFFFEHNLNFTKKIYFVFGTCNYYYSNLGWRFCPGFDFGYRFNEELKINGSIGQSFRVPTYTELFYSSPANEGNPSLKHEESWNYELGTSWMKKVFNGDFNVFYREGYDLIDWIRRQNLDIWQVKNITNVNTAGMEMNISFFPMSIYQNMPISLIQIGYAFLNSDIDTKGYRSKYVLNHPKHKYSFQLNHELLFGLKQNWRISYEEPVGSDSYYLIDTKISWRYKKNKIFVEATNLTNNKYIDIGSIPMPGRWIKCGIKLGLFGKE
jgi:vitamin B12 transporter